MEPVSGSCELRNRIAFVLGADTLQNGDQQAVARRLPLAAQVQERVLVVAIGAVERVRIRAPFLLDDRQDAESAGGRSRSQRIQVGPRQVIGQDIVPHRNGGQKWPSSRFPGAKSGCKQKGGFRLSRRRYPSVES
jgi:hypothetical protein